jgi:hypothetical protein
MNVCTVYASCYYFAFAHVSRASVLGVCTPLFLILYLNFIRVGISLFSSFIWFTTDTKRVGHDRTLA